jgi:hypothetical protein
MFVGVPKSDLHKIMADDEAEMFGVQPETETTCVVAKSDRGAISLT